MGNMQAGQYPTIDYSKAMSNFNELNNNKNNFLDETKDTILYDGPIDFTNGNGIKPEDIKLPDDWDPSHIGIIPKGGLPKDNRTFLEKLKDLFTFKNDIPFNPDWALH